MAGDTLEKTLEVDLSALDASLKKEEALQTSIEQRVAATTRKIRGNAPDFAAEFSDEGGDGLGRFQNRIARKGKKLAKRFLKGQLGFMLASLFTDLTSDVPGMEPGSGAHFAGNLIAASALTGPWGAAMVIIHELKDQWTIMKERVKQLEELQAKENELEEKRAKVFTDELRRVDESVQERFDERALRMIGETAELIYQSSQYLDQ